MGDLNRRKLIGTLGGSTLGILSGCIGNGVIDSHSIDDDTLDQGESPGITLFADQYCQIEYSADIEIPDEGFQDVGPVDIVTLRNENIKRWKNLGPASNLIDDGPQSELWTNNVKRSERLVDEEIIEQYSVVESGTYNDVNGEIDASFEAPAGIYKFIFNNRGERDVEYSYDIDINSLDRNREDISCEGTDDSNNIEYLSPVFVERPILRYIQSVWLTYHIRLGETENDPYELNISIITQTETKNIKESSESEICHTNFANVEEIELEDGLDDGDTVIIDVEVKNADSDTVLSDQMRTTI